MKRVTVSWRKAVWKSVDVRVSGDDGTYFVDGGALGKLYKSVDTVHGIILDSGLMIRDCTACGWVGSRFRFTAKSGALAYRSLYLQTSGHGFSDREHTGKASILDPLTQEFAETNPLPEYVQPGVTYGVPFSSNRISSTRRIEAWIWMTQAWGDAFDLHYLRLTYQYAVWAS